MLISDELLPKAPMVSITALHIHPEVSSSVGLSPEKSGSGAQLCFPLYTSEQQQRWVGVPRPD